MRDITGRCRFISYGIDDTGAIWLAQTNEASSISINGGAFLGAWGTTTFNFALSCVALTASENRPISVSIPMLISY